MTRRMLVGSLALAAAAQAQRPPRPKEWKPRLGILGPFTEANIAFARQEGFSTMILSVGPGSPLDAATATDATVDHVKTVLAKNDMKVHAFQIGGNHINPDPANRAQENDYFVRTIELAGKLGVSYLGTQSGKDPTSGTITTAHGAARRRLLCPNGGST